MQESPSLIRAAILLLLMLSGLGIAEMVRPSLSPASESAPSLSELIPTRFGDWTADTRDAISLINPEQKATLDRIYSQTLARTYVRPDGYRIMLSIAYGNNQSDTMQLHKPEICYPAQGFQLQGKSQDQLAVAGTTVPITRLLTQQGNRHEPVTYWIVIGDKPVRGGLAEKIEKLRYGISGSIPDGMLIRVSSIDSDDRRAFDITDMFLDEMLGAMTPTDRIRIVGHPGDV